MALSDTAIITAEDVRSAAEGSAVQVKLPEMKDRVEQHIESVTAEIEKFLGYSLIVRAYTHEGAWISSPLRTGWYALARAVPVVEVAGDDVTPLDSRYITADEVPDSAAYFAGYRRADQTLETLGVDGLTELPPVVPPEIRDAACDLVLLRMMERKGSWQTASEIQIGAGTIRRSRMQGSLKIDTDPALSILMRIRHHRILTP